MANSVGSVTFDVMNGSPSPPGTVAEALPRAVGEVTTDGGYTASRAAIPPSQP